MVIETATVYGRRYRRKGSKVKTEKRNGDVEEQENVYQW